MDNRFGFSKWKLHAFSSEQIWNEKATNAFDGNPDTFWHTQYKDGEPGYPHSISCFLEGEKTLVGVLTVQRQDMPNGRVKKCLIDMRWPKYWNLSFSIIPSKEHQG